MSMSQIKTVSSFTDIGVCPETPGADWCQIRQQQQKTTQPGMEGKSDVGCFRSIASPYSDAFDQTWDSSLSEYNDSVPHLLSSGYKEVCRTSDEVSPGKYAIFAVHPSAYQMQAMSQLFGLPPDATLPLGQLPVSAPAQQGIFSPCNPMLDGFKRSLPVQLTDATARYLVTKIPSIDGCSVFAPSIVDGDSCSAPASDTSIQYKLTTDPASIDRAIESIEHDIKCNSLPEGVSKGQADGLIAALNEIKSQDQLTFQQESADRMMAMQKDAMTIQIVIGIGSVAAMGGIFYYLTNRQIKFQREMMEGRLGIVTNALERYGRDLNAEFRAGNLEPMNLDLRNAEIQQARIALMQNRSVVFTGDAGTGKTAVAEGLAMGIERGLYPELKGTRIVMLDLNAMEAGTKYRGSFEERLQAVLEEVKTSQKNGGRVILFVDEMHRLMGAGVAEGVQGASQVLKTPLARGEITIIGATTGAEYRRSIASDPALQQRFSEVNVRPLTASETVAALSTKLSKIGAATGPFPEMRIPLETLREVVRLCERYIQNEAFPRKADSLLKEAVAYKRLQFANEPAKADMLTPEDVRKYFELKYQVSLNRGPGDDDPPPAPAGEPSAPAPQAAPDGSRAFSVSVVPPVPANMPALVAGDGAISPWVIMPEPAMAYAMSSGSNGGPRVVSFATPEGYIMRAVVTEEVAAARGIGPGRPGTVLEAGISPAVTSFGSMAAFNVGTGVLAWTGIHYFIEPSIGRELTGWEKMGVYAGTGVAGSATAAYLAGTSPGWATIAASVPVGFASFLPIGASVGYVESQVGIDPSSPEGELIIIGGGGLLAAAGATATLPAAIATATGVTTAAGAGLTAAGIGLGIGTGVAVGVSLVAGYAIGYGIDELIGEFGVCNSTGSDCSLSAYLGEKMADTWEPCPGDLECWAPWNWF